MFIKNPYNVIAKHYRLINLLMLIPMIYLLLKFQDISKFFKEFVASNYRTVESNFADKYVTSLTIGILAFVTIYNLIMYFILLSKKKKGFFYLLSAIIYAVIIILALLFHSSMNDIATIEPTFANFVRDMANLAVLPQYLTILITVINGLGFNFKTLRFEKKSALEIDEEEDEIEIKFGENNAAKRNAVHLMREVKYYVLENSFVFKVIGVVVAVIALIGLYVNIRITNRVYSINQAISADSFTVAVKESYITAVDYRGIVIDPDKYYLVVKIGLQNKGEDTPIDKAVFRLVVGRKTILPKYDRSSRFVDIGRPYTGGIIRTDQQDDYVFVYELTEKEVKRSYKIRMLNDFKVKDGNLEKSYKEVRIRPTNLTKKNDMGEFNTGKEINLKETLLGNSTFEISKVAIVPYYQYEIKACQTCDQMIKYSIAPSAGKALMVIEDKIKYDENSAYYKYSSRNFYEDFVTLKITPISNGSTKRKEVTSTMKDVTPKDLKGKKIYEVGVDAYQATKIVMKIRIRNNYFTLKLKG